MQKTVFSLAAIVLFSLNAASTHAATFLGEENVRVSSHIPDDVYVAGNDVEIEQSLPKDLYAAGRSVRITQTVNQDIHAIGELVEISGNGGEDVLAAGQSITITGSVKGDVLAAGSVLTITPSTEGIGGNVYAAGNSITINGHIKGSVWAHGNRITIASGASIDGDLHTYGTEEPTIQNGANVTGTTAHHTTPLPEAESSSQMLLAWARHVITLFLSAWILMALFPVFTATTLQTFTAQPMRHASIGFSWLLLCLPAALVCAIAGFGMSLGLLIALATAFLLAVSISYTTIVSGTFAAHVISRRFAPPKTAIVQQLSWPQALLGAVIISSLLVIGGVGAIVIMILVVITFGTILTSFWRCLRYAPNAQP